MTRYIPLHQGWMREPRRRIRVWQAGFTLSNGGTESLSWPSSATRQGLDWNTNPATKRKKKPSIYGVFHLQCVLGPGHCRIVIKETRETLSNNLWEQMLRRDSYWFLLIFDLSALAICDLFPWPYVIYFLTPSSDWEREWKSQKEKHIFKIPFSNQE